MWVASTQRKAFLHFWKDPDHILVIKYPEFSETHPGGCILSMCAF